jgi:hypothetical protein
MLVLARSNHRMLRRTPIFAGNAGKYRSKSSIPQKPYYVTTPIFYPNAGAPREQLLPDRQILTLEFQRPMLATYIRS